MSDAARRAHIVPVRMSASERADAQACARALGITVSRLLRSRAEALPPLRSATDLQAAAELGRIGATLNQLVRLAHVGFVVRLEELQPLLAELRERVTELRGRLRA